MFVIPYGAPEDYEWFVTLVVLVCLYFAVRFMRAEPRSSTRQNKRAERTTAREQGSRRLLARRQGQF